MYTNLLHYENNMNNKDVWLVQHHFYVKSQQHQHVQNQYSMLPIINQNGCTIDSTNKLKHKEVILYKTESCRNWTEIGHCRYGKKCRYAHGPDELRTIPRHSRYKTQICRSYHMDGSCPYGIRCTFVHDSDIQTQQDKTASTNYADLPLSTSPKPSLFSSKSFDSDTYAVSATIQHNTFPYRRRGSISSQDDESSTSGSSSGDESLASATLTDVDRYKYRGSFMTKRQEPIETMYDIDYNNNFNNNNRTTFWM